MRLGIIIFKHKANYPNWSNNFALNSSKLIDPIKITKRKKAKKRL